MLRTLFAALVFAGSLAAIASDQSANQVLKTTGVQGGLVVHLGCGDGQLIAALRANDSYLVHGLDTDPARVAEARKRLQSAGVYGPVSVTLWDGKNLPYADNLVNLIVIEQGSFQGEEKELLRALAPRGVALFLNRQSPTASRQVTKPWPAEIDQWTHNLHDAGGNPVSRDRVVGPPRHLQWTAGPWWARSHGWTPSVSAMVSAGGRLFYICDESLTGVDGTAPSEWFLTARDAFSGKLLWKRTVPNWDSKDFSGTLGSGAVPRFTMPPHLAKRLVADGEAVYVTLGCDAPVVALDAATGKELRTYEGTVSADEILLSDGRLIATLNPVERPGGGAPDPAPGKSVCAVDVKSGRLLWRKGPFTAVRSTKAQDPFGRLELVAGDGQVFGLTGRSLVCLDAATGATRWETPRPALPDTAVTRVGFGGVYEYLLSVMLYHGGVVLLAQPEPNAHHTYHTMPGTLFAFDAANGKVLWNHAYGAWGHSTPPDVFVAGDTVWTHVNADADLGPGGGGGGLIARNQADVDYRIQGLDLKTGAVRKELATKDLFNVGHHHRCYRNRSTEQYLMSSRRGVEFVDLATGENFQNHWVRSGCKLGNIPCNGLVYVAPHPFGCYIEAKLTGFNALAPASNAGVAAIATEQRLQRGPAYGSAVTSAARPDDWPTYRHDPLRSGATETQPATDLKVLWTARAGTRLSSVVVAAGRVMVADIDAHTVHALSAADGKQLWSLTADARVDSPPTIHDGLAVFGSSDGCVYCLRAADGALVWRFEAAPHPRRVMVCDQLESAWPVPGNVLVQDGKCWFAAGRSSYLDGGIRVYALDLATGAIVKQETIYHADPETGKMPILTSAQNMPGLLNDIPGSNGPEVFIRQMNVSSPEDGGGQHLFSTGGFRDASWFNRTFWKVGKAETSGLMVLGNDVAYGMELYASRSRETVFRPGSGAYRLRCLALKPPPGPRTEAKPKGKTPAPKPVWEVRVPIRVTALVRAGETLFVAGSPDVVDEDDPTGAWHGRKGGRLAAFAAADGKQLAEMLLPSPPVWDGMAIAGRRLYLALEDGSVVCLGAK